MRYTRVIAGQLVAVRRLVIESDKNYESNQRAITGAMRELDKVILERDSDAGAWRLRAE